MTEKVVISNLNEVYIQISCSDAVAQELNDQFSFFVPGAQFSPKYRNKMWNGRINLFSMRTHTLYRGLLKEVKKFCKIRDYECIVPNEVKIGISESDIQSWIETLELPLSVRDYQMSALINQVNTDRSLAVSATGSGKSLLIYLAVRFYHAHKNTRKSLIVVPTINLVTQLTSDFADYGLDADKWVHRLYGGQNKHTNRPITISTYQSLAKMPKEYFRQFDLVIVDEVHLATANSLRGILEKLDQCKYRMGTTGTLSGSKTHKMVLEGLLGTVFVASTTADLIEKKHLVPFKIKTLILKHPELYAKAYKGKSYADELQYIILNNERNRFISNLAMTLEGSTLVLFQFVEKHGEILYDMIREKVKNRNVYMIHGAIDGEEREDIRQLLLNDPNAILVASVGTTSTGINIPTLKNIVFASPSKSRIRVLQAIGRVLRNSIGKDSATLYDIADDMCYRKHQNYTYKHMIQRLEIYSQEKLPFKLYKIDLKKD